ncbi:hypothetical protein C0995_007571 [Termitomyces sp. Mi166|nr:hypothetical protein C0995_007571 [Termitomyces sp. Mi166\
MASTESQAIPRATSSKTLYTPIFYATPSSSLSGSEVPVKPIPKAYLERMSKQHIALATRVQEAPSSRPASPDSEERSAARVDALRRRVKEAFKYANGDPADGKWSAVVQLLKLDVTRRRRWLDTTTEGKMAKSSSGWINAETEEEWEEWEAKWAEEDRVNKKVQSWQRDIEAAPVESVPVVSISRQKEIQRAPTEQNVLAREKRTTSSLGFPVVKRSSLNPVGKPRGSMKASASNAAETPSNLCLKPLPRASDAPFDSSNSRPPRSIQDLSESIDTSTPNNKTQKRHKPEPIVFAPPSEASPLPTPPSIRTYVRQRTMSTLSEGPSSPTRSLRQTSTVIEAQREKRARSMTPPQAIKKARVRKDSSIRTPVRPPTPPAIVTPITPMVTPQRAQLPKLIDLIASSKKAKTASSKRKSKSVNTSSEATRITTPEPDHVKKVHPQPEPEPLREEEKQKQADTKVSEREAELEPEQVDDLLPAIIDGMSTGMYDCTIPLTNDEDPDNRDRSSVYNLLASPARSLSSLAASDSDSEPEDGHASRFDPPFTSTQVDGKDKTLGWMGYNSQFDVDSNVDLVSKFMEKDVDVDFARWLRDPSPEPAGESQ